MIIESKFDFKDVNSIILVVSELNQIYDDFGKNYLNFLKKHINDFNSQCRKVPPKNEEEEEKRTQRKKALYRLFIESYLYGIYNDFIPVKNLFVSLINPTNSKEQFFQDFPILVHLLKTFAEPLFNIISKKVKRLIEDGKVSDYQIDSLLSKSQAAKYYTGFREFYYKVVLINLEEEHKTLIDLEKKNFENMKKLDSNNEIQQSYLKQRNFYVKLISHINDYGNIMDLEVPEFANEQTFRYEEQKKKEMKLEKVNRYDPFSDETEYLFFTRSLGIQELLSEEEIEKILNKKRDEKDLDEQGEDKKRFDNTVTKILKCDSQEAIDEYTLELLKNPFFLSRKYRKSFLKIILRSSRSNLAVLKYFARLAANVAPFLEDIPNDIAHMLMDDFHDLNKDQTLGMLEEKIKNIRFISEMIKFDLFPAQNTFDILKRLIDDFKGHSIDLMCQLLENCGRYLYLSEVSHIKFQASLEKIRQHTSHRLRYDERAYNSIMNCLAVCKPQESSLKKKVKVRQVEEEYIRFLLYQVLNKETIKKVAVLLRRMNWDEWGDTILKNIYKFLNRGNEIQIKYCCAVLSILKDFHTDLIFNLVNTVLEEIRIGLERNDFNDNQHKILMSLLISHFYSFKIINSQLVFYVLYMIVTYNPYWNHGRRDLIADNPTDLPSDTFRIQMVIAIIDICGIYLNSGGKKEKLAEFIHFLQIYVLSKQYLPLEVENRIVTCLENLYSENYYEIFNDFSAALKASKKFKGLNFGIEEDESEISDKPEFKGDLNDFSRDKNPLTEANEEFKRKKEKKEKIEFNVDEEIQKIISESLVKNKGTTRSTQLVINPLADIKKKEMLKINKKDTKLKLITKQTNKVNVKEINKDYFQ